MADIVYRVKETLDGYVPSNVLKTIKPGVAYYVGMPLAGGADGMLEPTEKNPEYICMADFKADDEVPRLDVPCMKVGPQIIFEKYDSEGGETITQISGGGGVQSDLSVNDYSDPAFVKGVIRQESLPDGYPFDSRQIHTIEWDGDTTNKFVWNYSSDHDLCRVSDEVPFTAKNIIGQHIITNLSGMEEKDVIITEDMIDDRGSRFSVYTDSYKDTKLVFVVLDDTGSTQSVGVYFNLWREDAYGNLSGEHVVSISYESGKLEYMDDKFLPSVPGSNLPAGTPWKNIDKIPETIFEHSFSNGEYGSMGAIYYKNIPPAEGIADMTFVDGELYECIVNGNSFIMSVIDSTRLSGGNSAFANFDIRVDTSNSLYNITFVTGAGTFEGGPIDVKLLHINEVVTNHPVCDAVPDAAGETPTAAEFNALLAALRDGGIILAE